MSAGWPLVDDVLNMASTDDELVVELLLGDDGGDMMGGRWGIADKDNAEEDVEPGGNGFSEANTEEGTCNCAAEDDVEVTAWAAAAAAAAAA